MKNMILKPTSTANEQGWKKIDLSAEIVTNIVSRKYDYLLSLLSLRKAKYVAKNGLFFISCGDVDTVAECSENETVIRITEKGIAVIGQNEDAVSNGVKMLIDMKRVAPSEGEYPVGEFRYIPKMNFRGVHMCIFKPNDGTEKDDTYVADVRRRTQLAALCGYNYISYEFWGMFPYEKREYAHWPNAWSREDTEGLISFAIDDLHIIPFPTQNLTSHAGWSRMGSPCFTASATKSFTTSAGMNSW